MTASVKLLDTSECVTVLVVFKKVTFISGSGDSRKESVAAPVCNEVLRFRVCAAWPVLRVLQERCRVFRKLVLLVPRERAAAAQLSFLLSPLPSAKTFLKHKTDTHRLKYVIWCTTFQKNLLLIQKQVRFRYEKLSVKVFEGTFCWASFMFHFNRECQQSKSASNALIFDILWICEGIWC